MATYSRHTASERVEYARRVAHAEKFWDLSEADYRELARIEQRLQRWYERECNGEIERDEETGKVYGYSESRRLRWRVNDLETGAIKRAKAIANRVGGWIYFQTDPRGCAVYFFRFGRNGEPGPYRIGRDDRIDQIYSTQACACYF